jgi:hypothetical protein
MPKPVDRATVSGPLASLARDAAPTGSRCVGQPTVSSCAPCARENGRSSFPPRLLQPTARTATCLVNECADVGPPPAAAEDGAPIAHRGIAAIVVRRGCAQVGLHGAKDGRAVLEERAEPLRFAREGDIVIVAVYEDTWRTERQPRQIGEMQPVVGLEADTRHQPIVRSAEQVHLRHRNAGIGVDRAQSDARAPEALAQPSVRFDKKNPHPVQLQAKAIPWCIAPVPAAKKIGHAPGILLDNREDDDHSRAFQGKGIVMATASPRRSQPAKGWDDPLSCVPMEEYELLRRWHPNVLIAGPAAATAAAVALLRPHLRAPLVQWQAGGNFALSDQPPPRTLLIREVAALSADEQLRLLEWLRQHSVETQVVATTSLALLRLVEHGSFCAPLYYMLNVVYLEVAA